MDVATLGLRLEATQFVAGADKAAASLTKVQTAAGRASGNIDDLKTTLGRTLRQIDAVEAPVAKVAAVSTRTERAVSRVAMSLAVMGEAGTLSARGLRGLEMGMMTLVPNLGWGLVGVTALIGGVTALQARLEAADKAWADYWKPIQRDEEPAARIQRVTYELTQFEAKLESLAAKQPPAWLMAILAGALPYKFSGWLGVGAGGTRLPGLSWTTRPGSQMDNVGVGPFAPGAPKADDTAAREEQRRIDERNRAVIAGQQEVAKESAAAYADLLKERQDLYEEADRAYTDAMTAFNATWQRSEQGRLAYTLAVNSEIIASQAAESEAWVREMTERDRATETMLKDIQRAFASFFEDIYRNGIASFKSLVDGARDLFAKLMSDVTASDLMQLLKGKGSFGAVAKDFAIGGAVAFGTEVVGWFMRSQAAYRAAVQTFTRSMEDMRDAIMGVDTALKQSIRSAQDWADQARKQALALYVFDPVTLAAKWEEINRLEKEYIAQLEREAKLRDQQSKVDALTRTVTTLNDYRAGLMLGGSSPLGPSAQYAESRRQYDALVTAALGGDQTAAGKLPGAAQAFLDASRAMNASGPAYARDFAAVVATIDQISALYEDQRSIEEQILNELKGIHADIAVTIPPDYVPGGTLDPGLWGNNGGGNGTIVVLQAGFLAVKGEVASLRDDVAALTQVTKRGWEAAAA